MLSLFKPKKSACNRKCYSEQTWWPLDNSQLLVEGERDGPELCLVHFEVFFVERGQWPLGPFCLGPTTTADGGDVIICTRHPQVLRSANVGVAENDVPERELKAGQFSIEAYGNFSENSGLKTTEKGRGDEFQGKTFN